jgi:hypothetical protein
MGWANDARDALLAGKSATVRPRGGSMRGRIEDNEEITIEPVSPGEVEVNEVIFLRWKGGFLLHIVKQASDHEVLIGNNVGRINGWAPRSDILGRVRGR